MSPYKYVLISIRVFRKLSNRKAAQKDCSEFHPFSLPSHYLEYDGDALL